MYIKSYLNSKLLMYVTHIELAFSFEVMHVYFNVFNIHFKLNFYFSYLNIKSIHYKTHLLNTFTIISKVITIKK